MAAAPLFSMVAVNTRSLSLKHETASHRPNQVKYCSCFHQSQHVILSNLQGPQSSKNPLSNQGSLQWHARRHKEIQQKASHSRVTKTEGQGSAIASGTAESYGEREEARWLREEQRWLREEERWQREEVRWNAERQVWAQESAAFAVEIKVLKQELEQLRALTSNERVSSGSFSKVMTDLKSLLESLRSSDADANQPAVTEEVEVLFESSAEYSELSTVSKEELSPSTNPTLSMSDFSINLVSPADVIAAVASRTVGSIVGPETKGSDIASPSVAPTKQTLKIGSQGDDVRALQASIGVVEDGVISAELLGKMLRESNSASASSKKDKSNPTVASSPPKEREIDRFARSDAEEGTGNDRRVYLLGENRWEEPSRLSKKENGRTQMKLVGVEMCFSCRGEGVTLCTECEGTGDLNVEEQFLEWMEEGAKCPYCEGSGAVACDICVGKEELCGHSHQFHGDPAECSPTWQA